MRKFLANILLSALIVPSLLLFAAQPVSAAEPKTPTVAAVVNSQDKPDPQSSEKTNGQSQAARRRSYERETGRRHHPRITKKEMIFLGAIAGTSMGIGAIAGGAKGLAIGTIVGGWAAFAGHVLWNKLR